MFNLDQEKLVELGANITVNEIRQQPELWQQVLDIYQQKNEEIQNFINRMLEKHQTIKVMFAGAGTSAYIGDTICTYLQQKLDERRWIMLKTPTTDIVSNPLAYLQEDVPTLLVSFARSGNSPESIAAVKLARKLVKNLYQLTITCAPEGSLAQNFENCENNLLLMMPEKSNDKGFAMTGSYSCMALMALLVFDPNTLNDKVKFVETIVSLGKEIIKRTPEIEEMTQLDFNRVVYLGSGGMVGAARETQLKILELTAGRISTLFDSSMGFRHGPKSFVDEQTLIVIFISNDSYTAKYDLDILNELSDDQITKHVCGVNGLAKPELPEGLFQLNHPDINLPDAYLALPYVVLGQIISVLTAMKVGNKADTPSATGTVNRVVKGVVIHPLV